MVICHCRIFLLGLMLFILPASGWADYHDCVYLFVPDGLPLASSETVELSRPAQEAEDALKLSEEESLRRLHQIGRGEKSYAELEAQLLAASSVENLNKLYVAEVGHLQQVVQIKASGRRLDFTPAEEAKISDYFGRSYEVYMRELYTALEQIFPGRWQLEQSAYFGGMGEANHHYELIYQIRPSRRHLKLSREAEKKFPFMRLVRDVERRVLPLWHRKRVKPVLNLAYRIAEIPLLAQRRTLQVLDSGEEKKFDEYRKAIYLPEDFFANPESAKIGLAYSLAYYPSFPEDMVWKTVYHNADPLLNLHGLNHQVAFHEVAALEEAYHLAQQMSKHRPLLRPRATYLKAKLKMVIIFLLHQIALAQENLKQDVGQLDLAITGRVLTEEEMRWAGALTAKAARVTLNYFRDKGRGRAAQVQLSYLIYDIGPLEWQLLRQKKDAAYPLAFSTTNCLTSPPRDLFCDLQWKLFWRETAYRLDQSLADNERSLRQRYTRLFERVLPDDVGQLVQALWVASNSPLTAEEILALEGDEH